MCEREKERENVNDNFLGNILIHFIYLYVIKSFDNIANTVKF